MSQILTDGNDYFNANPKTENPRSIRKGLREGTLHQDALLTRLHWAILLVNDMALDHEIEIEEFDLFKSEVYGSLAGQSSGERRSSRLVSAFRGMFSS